MIIFKKDTEKSVSLVLYEKKIENCKWTLIIIMEEVSECHIIF